MSDYWEDRFARFGLIPPRTSPPPTARPPVNGHGDNPAYAAAALRDEAAQVAASVEGSRNDTLNTAAFNMAGLVAAGALDEATVRDTLTAAARSAGLADVEIDATITSGFRGSAAKVGARAVPAPAPPPTPVELNGNGHKETPPPTGRVLTWTRGDQIVTDVPVWAWSYNGLGRIQSGTLALLAGRPGAGKSTAARWFAAQATLGLLEGCWQGRPQNVAYIASEESLRYTIGPGLVAAGADMARLHFPSVTRDGEHTGLLSTLDELALLAYLREHHITVVIVDPLMSTVTATTDVNKNNEIRGQIAPWARLADVVGGITLGVVHLRKNNTGDVVAAITGSSAFGEVARAIFGFAKSLENDTRVMSQHKNSTGVEDLSLTYEIASVPVTTTSGKCADVGTFRITGVSEITVEDIMSDSAMNNGGAVLECQRWLQDYVSVEGPCASRNVKAMAAKEGWSASTVDRAARKLRMHIESTGFPRRTFWSLPNLVQSPPQTRHE